MEGRIAKASYMGIDVVVDDKLPPDAWMLVSVVAGRICVATPNCVQYFEREVPIRRAPRDRMDPEGGTPGRQL